jgi:L-2-hydroxycarboxylate dehydrogenase (NAD+)
MNRVPEKFILVAADRLQAFTEQVGQAAGLSQDRSQQLARLLVDNDCRGVFSHGTSGLLHYARLMREGRVNPEPQVTVVSETPTSALVDGDGGLGYFPAVTATEKVIEKAAQMGMAVGVSRNHHHFGAAGIYTRMMLQHDLICYSTSGHQLGMKAGEPLIHSAGGSPMSFATPTATEPPFVLDFGAIHGLYGEENQRLFAERAPTLVLRCYAMGQVCQSWGGLLAGLTIDPARRPWSRPDANQGAMMMAFRIDLFADPAAFKAEMDEYARTVRTLEPLHGYDASHMPGALEFEREQTWRVEGIPVGERHQQRLQEMADDFGVAPPWEDG